MTRCAARACRTAALVLGLALAAGPARADCFEWDSPAVLTEEGRLAGLASGPLRWRLGRAPAGGPHLATAVELRWAEPGGIERRQTLFDGIQNGLPALRTRRGALLLRITLCPIGGACRDATLTYAWDPGGRRFVGTDAAAREALAGACAAAGG